MIQNLDNITQWFQHIGRGILRMRWGVLCALVLLNALAIVGILRIQSDSSTENWFLEDDPLMIATREFEDIFGNDQFVAVLVEAEDVFAPEVLRVLRELGQDLKEQVPFAEDVLSLTDFEFTRGTADGIEIEELVPQEIPSDPAVLDAIRQQAFSKNFLVNRLFSDDGTLAWVSVRLSAYPDDWQSDRYDVPEQAVGATVLEILRQEKYRPYSLKAVGPPILTHESQVFFAQEANTLMVTALGVGVTMLCLFLRSFRGVVIPMITAISSICWVFGGMGHLGITVDNMLVTIPIFLGMAVSIGYSIHIFNFFQRRFVRDGDRQEAILYALGETGWPVFFTAATTVSALLAFYFVPILQVRWMGVSAAAVVLTTYLLVMTITPVLLSFGKNRPSKDMREPGSAITQIIERIDLALNLKFTILSYGIQRHARPIMVIFLLSVLFFLGGFSKVYVSSDLVKTVGLKIPYIKKTYSVGHSKVGSMDSYNVTLTYPTPGIVKEPEILRNLDLLVAEIEAFPLVQRVSSLLDVLKDMNQVMHDGDPARYQVPDSREFVAQLLLLYEIANGREQENWVDYDYTTLRVLVETSDFNAAEIERQFRILEQRVPQLFPEARFGMVGGAVQLSVSQNYIAKGEIVSFLIALVVIGFLMIIVFRSLKTGLIGMIPNLAPVIVVGGLMGYLDIPLQMTTMMIIPMLLGLAVDDTIHFITHCKLEFQRTGRYHQSIERTFQTVGRAIFMTSFILIATFCVYMTSIARFFTNLGTIAMAGVLAALLADYFITPILINWTKPYGPENPKM